MKYLKIIKMSDLYHIKQQRVSNFWQFRLKSIFGLIRGFENLEYQQMGSENHHRIRNINDGRFIDFWQTGTMRRSDNTFCGMGYRDTNIKKELEKLMVDKLI